MNLASQNGVAQLLDVIVADQTLAKLHEIKSVVPMVPVDTVLGPVEVGSAASQAFTISGDLVGYFGMGGHDTITGSGADDVLIGDFMSAELLDWAFIDEGGNAPDYDLSIVGNDVLIGNNGNDTLLLDGGDDKAKGGSGDDFFAVVVADMGADTFLGGSGSDSLSFGDPFLLGMPVIFTNQLILNAAASIEYVEVYKIDLHGTSAGDLFDFSGVEEFVGFDGEFNYAPLTDLLGGDDQYIGSMDDEIVLGGSGKDSISGGAGDDELNAGIGKDTMAGGAGADIFIFNQKLAASNVDNVTDFEASDVMYLENTGSGKFNALTATGVLAKSAFKDISSGAVDGNDRILYDKASGNIYYDADGSGATGRVLFVTVDAGTALTAADFLVI